MKVWITKHALTEGIQEASDAEIAECASTMISVPSLGTFADFHGEGREWHRNKASAIAKAEQMRVAKIAALEKAIKKLKAMRFE